MPKKNVGFILVFGGVGVSFASNNTDFYDADGNNIGTDYDGVNGAYNTNELRVNSSDRGCALSNGSSSTPSSGGTIYSCNGGCTRYSSSSYNIVNVLPNGSYFEGYGLNKSGATVSGIFVCDASGDWVHASAVTGSASSGCSDEYVLETYLTLRFYCGIGYHEQTIGDCTDFVIGGADTFVTNPYYYWYEDDSMFTNYTRACTYTFTSSDGTVTRVNNYSGCALGYKLSGRSCVSCGSLPNGGYNAEPWHTQATCVPYCDEGYGYLVSEQSCVAGAMDQYHLYEYGGEENDYRDCPDGALCDGTYVYCPAGSFVYSTNDGAEPYCVDCPGTWGMVSAAYNDKLESCTGVSGGMPYDEWGQGYADTTDCLWTDQVADTPETYCYEYMGSDNTGSYEYRSDDGEWEFCYYE